MRPLRTSLIAALSDWAVMPACFRASADGGAAGHGQGKQQPLDRDEAVAGLVRQLLRLLEQARRFGRHVELAGPGAFDLRNFAERRFGGAEGARGIAAGGTDQIGRQAFAIVQEYFEEMLGSRAAGGRSAEPGSAQPAGSRASARYISRCPSLPPSAPAPHQARRDDAMKSPSWAGYGAAQPRRKSGRLAQAENETVRKLLKSSGLTASRQKWPAAVSSGNFRPYPAGRPGPAAPRNRWACAR